MKIGTSELEALSFKIQTGIQERGRYLVIHPAELAVLNELGADGIHDFSQYHGWIVVNHLGGDSVEFFKGLPSRLIE
jgi:hypothetical protein